MRNSTSIKQVREAVRQKYAWPGGYPLYLVTSDSAALCVKCAKENWRQCARSTRYLVNDGWGIVGVVINYEDNELYCSHCSNLIETAYGD